MNVSSTLCSPDETLAHFLAASDNVDGAEWKIGLHPVALEEASEWEALAGELTQALRMGPGGLNDSQRASILEAAAHPVVLGTGTWKGPLPKAAARTDKVLVWKALGATAAAACVLLMAGRHIASPGGIDPDQWAARLAPRVDGDARFHVRLLPGESVGSLYAVARPGQTTQLASSDGDWSAVGIGGGFQPAAMANVAELVPAPPLPDAPDLLPSMLGIQNRSPGSIGAGDLLNHFAYDYPSPAPGEAVSVTVESGPCPWNPGNKLVHVGLRATSDPKIVPGRYGLAASDLRLLVDFNPARVAAYRLVGHGPSPRQDRGEQWVRSGADLLAGQSVTAIYEVVPVGGQPSERGRQSWKSVKRGSATSNDDLLTAKVTYRNPGKLKRVEKEFVLEDTPSSTPSEDFRFASAVAACALLIDEAPGMQRYALGDALALAQGSLGRDPEGKRSEFVRLLAKKQAN